MNEGAIPNASDAPKKPDEARARADLKESRRLFDVACLVQSRGSARRADAAPLLQRSLHLALGLVVRLRGGEVGTFEETVARADALNKEHQLFPYDLEPLSLAGRLAGSFLAGDEVARPDAERLDRLFDRAADLLTDLRGVVEQQFVSRELRARRRRRLLIVLGSAALAALAAGVAFDRLRTPRGITATYYRDANHLEPVFKRRDKNIDFDWGEHGPKGLGSDGFGIRWEGLLDVPAADTYRFFLESDDGARLFIDEALVIDHWGDHGFSALEGTHKLTRGLHHVRVDYYERNGNAAVRLSWASPGIPKQVIPSGSLR